MDADHIARPGVSHQRHIHFAPPIDLLSFKLAAHLGAALAEADARQGLAVVMTNNLDAYHWKRRWRSPTG